jgi:molecular chaperone GrpE
VTDEQRIEELTEEAPAEETPPEPQPDPLVEVTRERDEYLDSLQRLKAEFDNYRKRTAREQLELSTRAGERLVNALLPVLDDLERALEAAEQHEEAKLEDGVRLVHRALADTLAREGLAEIDANGKFDPHVHEALLTQPADGREPGDVLQVLQKGYRLGERVLRPARVIVAAESENGGS